MPALSRDARLQRPRVRHRLRHQRLRRLVRLQSCKGFVWGENRTRTLLSLYAFTTYNANPSDCAPWHTCEEYGLNFGPSATAQFHQGKASSTIIVERSGFAAQRNGVAVVNNMGTAASTADTRLEVNELATWTIAEVAHVRAFYAREALPFAMGEEEFVTLFSGAGLSSKNVYGRISTVTTLPHDLWHVCSSEGHDGGSSDDDEHHHHDDDDAASQTHSELAGFAGAGAAAARAAAAKEHGLPPPPERAGLTALRSRPRGRGPPRRGPAPPANRRRRPPWPGPRPGT